MTERDDDQTIEATAEQLAELRDLGVAQSDLQGLSVAEAEDWIAELRALREDAGRVGGA